MDEHTQYGRLPIEEPEPLSGLGICLSAGFTASDHESLADDMTRSLLHLSREAKAPSMRVRLAVAALPLADEVLGS
jgi:hypothetical protein